MTRLLQYGRRFREIFSVELDDYWDGENLGLDVVKFDAEIIKSGDHPMIDIVNERYGAEAVTLIRLLL